VPADTKGRGGIELLSAETLRRALSAALEPAAKEAA
jgi:hypothetical protein